MARGTTLEELVSNLRAEVGELTDDSVGTSNIPALKVLLRRVQETLYHRYDWPFLKHMPFKNLAADQRYYDVPAGLNMDRIIKVSVWYSGVPVPIERGIGEEEFQSYASDDGEKSSPALKWDWKWVQAQNADMIEVWPIPASNDERLQFTGLRPLKALIANDDVADLDDQLIVLYAAVEILARREEEDAKLKLKAAEEYFALLTGNYTRGRSPIVMGGGPPPASYRGKSVIRVGRA